jgi:hypothetical protein
MESIHIERKVMQLLPTPGVKGQSHAGDIYIKHVLLIQPRTQAQITKNRHTTVFLYRSVAKLSERAGVLGEDAAG